MKKYILKLIHRLWNAAYAKSGWILGDNVLISIHGVKKMGGVKYIVPTMSVSTLTAC